MSSRHSCAQRNYRGNRPTHFTNWKEVASMFIIISMIIRPVGHHKFGHLTCELTDTRHTSPGRVLRPTTQLLRKRGSNWVEWNMQISLKSSTASDLNRSELDFTFKWSSRLQLKKQLKQNLDWAPTFFRTRWTLEPNSKNKNNDIKENCLNDETVRLEEKRVVWLLIPAVRMIFYFYARNKSRRWFNRESVIVTRYCQGQRLFSLLSFRGKWCTDPFISTFRRFIRRRNPDQPSTGDVVVARQQVPNSFFSA